MKSGNAFYVDDVEPADILSKIQAEIPITVWWYLSNGTRCEEEMVWTRPEEDIIFVRTDKDAK